jgi:predicted 2-oxoglutarate/Fe(II)-dependent dioxygenase YbiX
MPFPDFFEQFGIYSEDEFLSAEFCEQLCFEMKNATATFGTVWNQGIGDNVKEEVKKRKEYINLPPATELQIREKLLRLMPKMAEHFSVELRDVQPIKFTRYDEGDFYRMHLDISPHAEAPAIINDRQVSVIIFINQEGENLEEGDYVGGNLTFYGLLNDANWQNVGLPLESETGLLIAFLPNIPHEVTTVTEGSRFTITTWFV